MGALDQGLRLLTEPPEALLATIVWDSGDGDVTLVNVWGGAPDCGRDVCMMEF